MNRLRKNRKLTKAEKERLQEIENRINSTIFPVLKNSRLFETIKSIQPVIEKSREVINRLIKPIQSTQKISKSLNNLIEPIKLNMNQFFPTEIFDHRLYTTIAPPQKSLTIDDVGWIAEEIAEKVIRARNPNVFKIMIDDGCIYREPKEKYIQPLDNYGLKVSFLRHLTYRFMKTEELQKFFSFKNKRGVNTIVQKINNIGKKKLGLDLNLIEGRQEEGYRLSPNCIVFEDGGTPYTTDSCG